MSGPRLILKKIVVTAANYFNHSVVLVLPPGLEPGTYGLEVRRSSPVELREHVLIYL